MHSNTHKITPKCLKRIFLLICISCVILWGFYLYYEKYDALLVFARSRIMLHPHAFRNETRIRLPDACLLPTQEEMETAVVFVVSSSHHRLRRQIIRSSWAQHKILTTLRLGVVFVVDETNNSETLTQNGLESQMFDDIIRANRTNSHSYDVQKTIIGFQWVIDHCPAAKFIIKAEDDVFINLFTLRQLLQELSGPPSVVVDKSVLLEAKENAILNLFKDNVQGNYEHALHDTNNPFDKMRRVSLDRGLSPARQDITRDLKFVILSPKPAITKNQLFNKILPSAADDGEKKSYYDLDDHEDDFKYRNSAFKNLDRVLICLVLKNVTVIKDLDSKSVIDKDFYPTYCSPAAYIVPVSTAKVLVEAHRKKLLSDILPLEEVYITGILAKEEGIDYVQIGTRYAFKRLNIETIATGDIIFTQLEKDVEALTNIIWNRVIENRKIEIS